MTKTVVQTPPLTAQEPAVQSAATTPWRWSLHLGCGHAVGSMELLETMRCPNDRCRDRQEDVKVLFALRVAEEAPKHEETTAA